MNSLLQEADNLLKDGGFAYAVCGGYAIELFLDKTVRQHGDLDISVFWNERDKIILFMQLLGWRVYELCGGGMAHSITDVANQIKAKRNIFCMTNACETVSLTPANEPDQFIVTFDPKGQDKLNFIEFLFNNTDKDRFLYARNHDLSLPLSLAILTRQGIKFLAPEMVLLYKSTDTERKGYQLDYDMATCAMTAEQRNWLKNALEAMNPNGHKWLDGNNGTTDRIGRVRAYINNILDLIEDADEKRAAYIHSYGVSHCCALLAVKRGLNLELATIIGLLHDVYSYKTGVTAWHSQNGAEMVRVAFKYRLADLFTDEEQTIIKSAIYHHANKDMVHDEYDEMLKDSDILQRLSFDTTYGWAYGQRLLRIMQELLLPTPIITVLPKKEVEIKPFIQSNVGDIAVILAEKQIEGKKSNTEYMRIIRYFPEETAFGELKNAWCAAFVYHCCFEAGLPLPIRVPHTAKKVANCRFACVVAWYEWGMENGFCYFEKDGFVPKRGDIVIYNSIIPREDKPENSTWCDHIGVVVSCGNNALLVAEGNVGNNNVSGMITRKRDDTIGCYIRIPEDYTYDGWKTDFKTGETKIVEFAGNS